jgi:capsular polysaccharide biosynthesis protein
MNISYQAVIDWFKSNFKLLILLEAVCIMTAAVYFLLAPRIYEANFAISLPKVLASPGANTNQPKHRLLMSPQEFIRPTQDPMIYSDEFIKNCMGQDSNENRKKLINALQLGVKQQGDVIAFTLRLEGSERSANCANLMLTRSFDDLTVNQDRYLQANPSIANDPTNFIKPALVQSIRISDSYIKPDLGRLLSMAILAGIFVSIFISILRKKYRA